MPINYADRVQSFDIELLEAIDKSTLDTLIALSLDAQSAKNAKVLCQVFYYESRDMDMTSLAGTQECKGGLELSMHNFCRAQALDIRVGNHNYQVFLPYKGEATLTLRASFRSEKALAKFAEKVKTNVAGKLIAERLFTADAA